MTNEQNNKTVFHQYDRFSKFFLKNLQIVIDLLETYLEPNLFNKINLNTISYNDQPKISDNLQEFLSDVVLKASSITSESPDYNFLLFVEEQTKPSDDICLRLVNYIFQIYLNLSSNKSKNLSLPLPICLIIHPGPSWSNFKTMQDLIPESKDLNYEIFKFPVHLIDLATEKLEEKVMSPELNLFLYTLHHGFNTIISKSTYTNIFNKLLSLPNDKQKLYITPLLRYIYSKISKSDREDAFGHISTIISREEAKNMIGIYEQEIRNESFGEGIAQATVNILKYRFKDHNIDQNLYDKIISITNLEELNKILLFTIEAESIDEFIKKSNLY
jgi:hypothetical protein